MIRVDPRRASIFDIAYIYIETHNLKLNVKEKKVLLNDICILLNEGFSSCDLIQSIKSIKNLKSSDNFVKKIKIVDTTRNLINPVAFYYHNELRITPAAPIKSIDINSGIITTEEYQYYLEMRASYNIDDFVTYISNKDSFKNISKDKSRAIGSLKFLLKKHTVEEILFMIDTVNDIYIAKNSQLKTLIDISNYQEESSDNFIKKKSEATAQKQDVIVPKKRIIPMEKNYE